VDDELARLVGVAPELLRRQQARAASLEHGHDVGVIPGDAGFLVVAAVLPAAALQSAPIFLGLWAVPPVIVPLR
jgi:hypothetical protein